jgi:hypothetical protein
MLPGGVIVFSALFLVFGLFGLVFNIFSVANLPVGFEQSGVPSNYIMISLVTNYFGMLFGVSLIVSGIGLLARKLWARNLAISLGIIGVVLALANLALNIYLAKVFGMGAQVVVMVALIVAGLGIIFYSLVVWFFNTPQVRLGFGVGGMSGSGGATVERPIRPQPGPRPTISGREPKREIKTEPLVPHQGASAWLIEKVGPRPEQMYTLRPGRTRIGRGNDNDIVLDDQTVSSRHAMIFDNDGKFHIRELEATNPTKVNGKIVREHDLLDNDVIEIANVQLVFKKA